MSACKEYTEGQEAALCGKHALNTLLGDEETIADLNPDAIIMKNGKVQVNLSALCSSKRQEFEEKRKQKKPVTDQYDHIFNMKNDDFDAVIKMLEQGNEPEKKYAEVLKSMREKKNSGQFFDCNANNQYFSEDILTLAIDLLEYTWNQMTLFSDSEIDAFYKQLNEDLSNKDCIGAIVCIGRKQNSIRSGGWHWTTLKTKLKCKEKDNNYYYFDPMNKSEKSFEPIPKGDLQTKLEEKIPIGYIAVFQTGPIFEPVGAAVEDPEEIRSASPVASAPAPTVPTVPTPVGAPIHTRDPSVYTLIQLGSKFYNLPTGESNNAFRAALFAQLKTGNTPETYEAVLRKLTDDERAILQDTGFIKESFLIKHADSMAKFFEALPNCTTDTAVMLNRQCDTSYFLIYALLHSAAQERGDQYELGKPMTDLELLKQQAVLTGLKPGDDRLLKFVTNLVRIRTPGQSVPVIDLLSDYAKLRKEARDKDIEEIFTLYY